jgi:hypothetical protein
MGWAYRALEIGNPVYPIKSASLLLCALRETLCDPLGFNALYLTTKDNEVKHKGYTKVENAEKFHQII